MKAIVSLMALCALTTSVHARLTHQSVDKDDVRVKKEVIEPLFNTESTSFVIKN